MKLLYRYISKEFFVPFLYSFAILCVLFTISEFFFRLQDFIAYHASIKFIIKYLVINIPIYFRDSLPVAMLTGIVFCFNRLNRDNEIIAIKSSGINPAKATIPIFFWGLVFAIFGIYTNINLVPETYYKVRMLREVDLRKTQEEIQKKVYNNIVHSAGNNTNFIIEQLDLNNNTMTNVTIDYFTEGGSTLNKQVKTRKMIWQNDGWALFSGIERTFNKEGTEITTERKFDSCKLSITDKPQDFIPKVVNLEELTLPKLHEEIARLKKHSLPYRKELVHYYFRISYPFSCIVISLFAIPFALRLGTKYARVRGIGYVITIAFLYWIVTSFGKVLGESWIFPPLLGAWFSNILFLVLGICLFRKISK